MPNIPSTHEEKCHDFWARYAEKVLELGAKPPFDRWLVLRAEEYVAAHPGRKLADQSAAEVVAYLAALGRKPEVTGWQVRQADDAIRVPLELAGVAWVNAVDWAHWQASARDLGPSHPTVARDYELVAADGASAAMPFAVIRAAHGPILERAIGRPSIARTLAYGGATTRMSGKLTPAFWFLGLGSASAAVRRHPSGEKGLRAGPTPPIFTGSHRL
jgi:hypothetical protein